MSKAPVKSAFPSQTPADTPRKGRKSRDFGRNNLAGYLFISPWLIGFFLFGFIPIAISLFLAFTDYDVLGGWNFIGLGQFRAHVYPRYSLLELGRGDL